MATKARHVSFLIAGVLNASGALNAAGTVEFFEPDGAFTTPKTAWADAAKVFNAEV